MDRQTLSVRDLGKTRRRRVLAIVAVLGAIAIVLPALAGAAGGAPDSPTPPKDIYSYAVFGWDSIMIKGKNDAKVFNGNVGVNNPGGKLNICQNGALQMNAGTALVGDKLSISTKCKLHDLYWGTGNQPSSKILDKLSYHGGTSFNAPLNPTNVPAPSEYDDVCLYDHGFHGPDYKRVIVKEHDGTVYAPPPGVYQSLAVKDGNAPNRNTVRLSAGKYVFCNVTLGRDVWFDLHPNTTIVVAGVFSMSNTSAIGHVAGHKTFDGVGDTANAQWFVRGDHKGKVEERNMQPFQCQMKPKKGIEVKYGNCDPGAHVHFSKQTWVRSSFMARNGQINLGHGTDLFGRFWANSIGSDVGTRIIAPPPPTGSTTTTTSLPETTTPPTTGTTTTTTIPTTVPPTTGTTTTTSTTTTVPPTVPTTIRSTTTTTLPET